jgi:hypothetical protein
MRHNIVVIAFLLFVVLAISAVAEETTPAKELSVTLFGLIANSMGPAVGTYLPECSSALFDVNGDGKLEVVFTTIKAQRKNFLNETIITTVTITTKSLTTDEVVRIVEVTLTGEELVSGFLVSEQTKDRFSCDLIITTKSQKIVRSSLAK